MTVDEIISKNFDILISDVKTRHSQAGQKVTGKTINSLQKDIIESGHHVLYGNQYIGVLEHGRRPGKVPYNFIQILREWANAKGITFENEKQAQRWLNYNLWSIKTFGTKMYRTKQTLDIFTTPIEQFKNRLSQELSDGIEIQITNNIFKDGNNSTT